MSDSRTPAEGESNRVGVRRPPEFPALELHHGLQVTIDYPRHWHDEFYLSATIDGVSYLKCSGATLVVAPGQLAMLPPGEVHANQKVRCTARAVFLDFPTMREAVEQFVERPITGFDFRPQILDDRRAVRDFMRMHRSLERPHFELEQEQTLLLFLGRIAARHGAAAVPMSRETNEDAAVRSIKRFLEAHYAARVLLGDLARLSRLSPYHLNRAFCRRVGMPPHAYQTQLRLAHAKRHLRLGRSASETACLVGFFDQSHFVHAFKRSEGIAPGQYVRLRKNLQDGRAQTVYLGSGSR